MRGCLKGHEAPFLHPGGLEKNTQSFLSPAFPDGGLFAGGGPLGLLPAGGAVGPFPAPLLFFCGGDAAAGAAVGAVFGGPAFGLALEGAAAAAAAFAPAFGGGGGGGCGAFETGG